MRQPREWGGFLYLLLKKLSPLNAKAVPWRLRVCVNLASGAVSFTYILKNYPHSVKLKREGVGAVRLYIAERYSNIIRFFCTKLF